MKVLLLTCAFSLMSLLAAAQNVSINNTGANPDPSAMLDVASDAAGVLIPRMTTAQRNGIVNPATGLLVFDTTTETFWYRLVGGWIELTDNYHGLQDMDRDTKVQVEENPDEDIIRFDIGGKEAMILTQNANNATRLDMGPDQGLIIGRNAGSNSFPGFNTIIGHSAGASNLTGEFNVFLGYQAGESNVDADRNTIIGYQAGQDNIASFNTMLGYHAGTNNTTGNHNSFLGHQSAFRNTTGYRNTFFGSYSGYNNDEGFENTFLGNTSGYANTTGDRNTFIGVGAGRSNRTGLDNIAIGHSAGGSNVGLKNMGNGNILMGFEADFNIEGGSHNFIAGYRTGYGVTTGGYNVYIGREAGYQSTNGSSNVGIGHNALRHAYNGSNNVAVGDSALMVHINSLSTAVGSKAGRFATGYLNTFVGHAAGYGITSGVQNVHIGASTGTGHNATTTTLVGYNAHILNPLGDIFNSTALGYGAVVRRAGTVILGNASAQTGIGTSLPDARLHVNSGAFEDPLTVSVDGTPKLYVDNDGRVHVDDSITVDRKVRIGNIHAGTRSLAVEGNAYFDDELRVGDYVLINTDAPLAGHHLTVDGKIVCEEVRVQDSGDWPDYVFSPEYELQSLQEVKAFIEKENHLPGIPSAAEIAETGIVIGEIQKRLLEKIEELTLHMIRLEAEIETLKSSK